MSMFIWLWLGAIVLFGVAEVVTESMISIWFVAGSLAALFTCMSGWALGGLSPEATQVLVFAVVSALALALVRPAASRFVHPRRSPTNADRVLGPTATVIHTVDHEAGTGQVTVRGQIWTARSALGGVIPEGSQVRVRRIEGVKVFVETM